MPQPFKIAFIGGGIRSAIGTTHKIAAQMDGRFQLVTGVFSRDQNVNEETAQIWGVESCYKTTSVMYETEKDRLDAVVVLTPTNMHTNMIIDALNLNIPVICEKTLTNSLADAYRIREKLTINNGFLVTTYNYTGYPMLRELRHMIRSGRLGQVIQINIQMPQESFIRLDKNGNIPKPQDWRRKDYNISTLSLDLGTHLSNMISFLTGEAPCEVVAQKNSFGHFDVIDNMLCLIRYTNNIDVHMWYSKSALGHKNGLSIEIYGTEGSAKWYQMDPEFLQFNDNMGRNITLDRSSKDIEIADQRRYNRFKSGHPAGFIEAFANHYEDIYEALIRYKNGLDDPYNAFVFDIDDSIRELKLMDAIQKSTEQKKWIKIDA